MQGVSSHSGQLCVIHYNARSFFPKIDEFRAIPEAKHPDLICIVESWLSNEIQDNELVASNYHLARLDHIFLIYTLDVVSTFSYFCKLTLQYIGVKLLFFYYTILKFRFQASLESLSSCSLHFSIAL